MIDYEFACCIGRKGVTVAAIEAMSAVNSCFEPAVTKNLRW
jgi:hypothetical protein